MDALEVFIAFMIIVVLYLTWRVLAASPEELPYLADGEGGYIIELPSMDECESCEQKDTCPLYKGVG